MRYKINYGSDKKNNTHLHAVAQPFEDGSEVWPLLRYWVPALAHEAVHRPRTEIGRFKASSVCHKLHDLLVASPGVWHVAEGHYLPQKDPERPGKNDLE